MVGQRSARWSRLRGWIPILELQVAAAEPLWARQCSSRLLIKCAIAIGALLVEDAQQWHIEHSFCSLVPPSAAQNGLSRAINFSAECSTWLRYRRSEPWGA